MLEQNHDIDQLWQTVCRLDTVAPRQCLDELIALARVDTECKCQITADAYALIDQARKLRRSTLKVEFFLQEYNLDTNEGIILLCLAEALLRIPDNATIDQLIEHKLAVADWEQHIGHSSSWLVNASTWGLMLTGRLENFDHTLLDTPVQWLGKLLNRLGEPLIRSAFKQAMKLMGSQFVLGDSPATGAILQSDLIFELLIQAGIPSGVVHFLPTTHHICQTTLLQDSRVAGIALSGCLTTLRQLHQTVNR